MAGDKVILSIKADAHGASEEMGRIAKAAERVKAAWRGIGGASSTSGGTASGGSSPASAQPPNAQQADARRAGSEIGRFFIAYVATKAADTAFSFFRDPLTSNAAVDRAQGAFSGGFGGAMAGATALTALGPYGMAAGAVIGGLSGGLLGYLGEDRKIKMRTRLASYQRGLEDRAIITGEADASSDEAFGMRLTMAGSRSRRMALLRDRIATLTSGGGRDSIESLTEQMRMEEKIDGTDSSRYNELSARRRAQMARRTALSARLRALERAPQSILAEGADYSDSYAARGFKVGGVVNIASENQDLLAELRKINANLESMSAAPDKRVSGGILDY